MAVELVLGVDGGNSKTLALVALRDGTIIGWGRSGCGDLYGATSEAAALGEIEAAIETALSMAGKQAREVSAAGFSLAGADWPEDFAFLGEAMQAHLPHAAITVVNDAMGPLRANAPNGIGVAVNCGTGLAIGARGNTGASWHGSFWLESHGAWELGLSALRSAVRAELGIAAGTSLTGRIAEYYGEADIERVLHRVTARARTPGPAIAGFAPILLDEAEAGDTVARNLVCGHGAAMAEYALAAARRVCLSDSSFDLVLAGGVFRHPSPLLADSLIARVRMACPAVHPGRSRFEPVVGALLLGFDAAALSTDDRVMAHLAATRPPNGFFATGPEG
jgi:N-acetylglucosamine kinase-like BadF-type ATPase